MCCDHAPADVKPGWSLGSDRGVWKQASATALGRSRSGYGWGRRRRRRFSEANGRHVRRIVGYGLSVYRVDLELLNRLAPNRHRHVDPVRRVRRQAEGCRASGARPREFAYCHRVARTLALRNRCSTSRNPPPKYARQAPARADGGVTREERGSRRRPKRMKNYWAERGKQSAAAESGAATGSRVSNAAPHQVAWRQPAAPRSGRPRPRFERYGSPTSVS